MKKEKSHGVQLLLRCVVRDPDGKVISDTGRKPAKSFVIQFLEFIFAMFNAPDWLLATDVAGAESAIYDDNQSAAVEFRADAGINVSAYGVVVGTGDTAQTNLDNVLETQLTEGVGVGNITHGVVVLGAVGVVGANVDVEISRAFTNQTGAAITVEEAGIYVTFTAFGPNRHCIIRDVLGASVDVPNGCSLTVIYTFRTTV